MEENTCPCCGEGFRCQPGNIAQCECFGIKLSPEQRQELDERFGECVCRKCLSVEAWLKVSEVKD
jgi:hypothetical protein